MRILFAGTPQIAVPTLRSLAEHYEIGGVLTNPDRAGKRRNVLVPPPVKEEALRLSLPVFQFEHLRSAERAAIASCKCDTLVCFAYGKLFGPKFLSLFPHAALNIHPSLLPLFRGPSPIQSAILSGASETGISIQRLAAEMDSGDLASVLHIPLNGDETAESLTERVSLLAADLAVKTLASPLSFTSQQGEPSYCRLIGKDDGLVDWKESATVLSSLIRALYPWPKAYTIWKGERLFLCGAGNDVTSPVPPDVAVGTVVGSERNKGIAVATGKGLLYVTRLQKPMKKEMDALSFVNGERSLLDSRLG